MNDINALKDKLTLQGEALKKAIITINALEKAVQLLADKSPPQVKSKINSIFEKAEETKANV